MDPGRAKARSESRGEHRRRPVDLGLSTSAPASISTLIAAVRPKPAAMVSGVELAFHPNGDVIASGLLDGKVCLYLCTHRCPSTCGRVGRQQQQL